MKRLCLSLLLLFVVEVATAQTYTFNDIEWGSSRSTVQSKMVQGGFLHERTDEDGDLWFEGYAFGHPVQVLALFVDSGVAKITYRILTPDNEALPTFAEVARHLVSRYDKPDKRIAEFNPPYEMGDGYEQQAIKQGDATLALLWDDGRNESAGMMLHVTDVLTVDVLYESPAWVEYVDKQRQQDASLF